MTKTPDRSDVDRLEAVRARLETVLEDPDTHARDLATVAREYRILLEKLSLLRPSSGRSTVDEIAARRAKRATS